MDLLNDDICIKCYRCGKIASKKELMDDHKNKKTTANTVSVSDCFSITNTLDHGRPYRHFLCPKCMKEFFQFMGLSEYKIGEFVYEDMSRFNSVDNKVNTELKDLQEENQKLRDDVIRLSMEKFQAHEIHK